MKSSGRNFQTKGQIGLQGSRLERWIDNNLQYLLLAPAVAILLFLTIYPTIRLITLCFYEYDFMNPADSKFVGLKNFTRLFTDSRFHQSLGNTLKFTIVVVSVEFILGLGLALLFSRVLRGLSYVRTLLLLPMMVAPLCVAITWHVMFNGQFGVINDILYKVGIEDWLYDHGFVDGPILWLFKVGTALPTLMFIDIWQQTPFVFLMMLAALASLPREPYEAAEIDGANSWQQFRDLTWRFITPIVTIVILLRTMDAFRVFETMYIMTFGGPSGATESITTFTYKIAFRNFEMGYAAALSIVMLVITITFSLWFIKQMVRQGDLE